MFRRWLIRSIFMLPILPCIIGWVGSYYSPLLAVWTTTNQTNLGFNFRGEFVLAAYRSYNEEEPGMALLTPRMDDAGNDFGFMVFYTTHQHGWLGFRWNTNNPPSEAGMSYWALTLPFWFLIIVFSLALFFVWRKTRPKPNPAIAFPVEMKI